MSSALLWAFGALGATFISAIPCVGFNCATKHALKSRLSNEAEIYLPSTEGFVNTTNRWSAAVSPDFNVIVKVATEKDVQETIRYANSHEKPFLAISGSHGTASTLNNVNDGVGILMHGMNEMSIVDDGYAALIGGGVFNGDLIPFLWSHGKQTVTTGCDCVGYIAPILGGGHGWLQGRYGLAADQLISARIVIANGTALTVSETENSDLFWAIRGAGHNFGVVTQVKMRVYEREAAQDEWAASGFVFTQDKMEKVFGIANQWLESPNRPVELIHYGVFAFNPDVDPDNPLVIFWVYWQGPSVPPEYSDPLNALKPIAVDNSVTNLAGVNTHLAANREGAACAKGSSRLMWPISLNVWSITNLRIILDLLAQVPTEFRNSVVMLEAYATNRVGQIPDESTAFPDRDGQLLAAPLLTYPANASLDAIGVEIGDRMRTAFLKDTGLPLEAYVNYARGDESLEAVYGYEPWRLEKLRRLKKEFDPFGRFNFFAPIS